MQGKQKHRIDDSRWQLGELQSNINCVCNRKPTHFWHPSSLMFSFVPSFFVMKLIFSKKKCFRWCLQYNQCQLIKPACRFEWNWEELQMEAFICIFAHSCLCKKIARLQVTTHVRWCGWYYILYSIVKVWVLTKFKNRNRIKVLAFTCLRVKCTSQWNLSWWDAWLVEEMTDYFEATWVMLRRTQFPSNMMKVGFDLGL